MVSFLKRALAAVFLLATSALRAEENPETRWPDVPPEQRREMAFELRMRVKCEIDGDAAGEKFLRREFARDPNPAVKTFMARMCFFGKDWGMPTLVDPARGRVLAEEAIAAGSASALEVLGCAAAEGLAPGLQPSEAIPFLQRGVERGVPRCMARMGWYQVTGWNQPVNFVQGMLLARRAAELGNPGGLVDIALAFEKGTAAGGPNVPAAAEIYRQAWRFGSRLGREGLERLAASNERAQLLFAVERARVANEGRWMMPKRGTEFIARLEAMNSPAPEALTELAIAHAEGYYTKRNVALAREMLETAKLSASEDAKFELARLSVEGIGSPRDPAALEEIRAMADAGNARAAKYYGFVHYWGTSMVPGLKKDEAKAFRYMRLAAQKGDIFALANLAFCYEHGLGTKEDYLLAAKLYWEAFKQGFVDGSEKARRNLNFVKE